MPDTKGQHTNEKEAQKTDEKKDEGQTPKGQAGGAEGDATDNTSAGSGGRGGNQRRRSGGGPQGD